MYRIFFYQVYVTWLYMVFMYIIPLLLLTVLNMLIYTEVKRARNLREELSRYFVNQKVTTDQKNCARNRGKELGLTVMLLAVVLVFLICNMLALVVNIMEVEYS